MHLYYNVPEPLPIVSSDKIKDFPFIEKYTQKSTKSVKINYFGFQKDLAINDKLMFLV